MRVILEYMYFFDPAQTQWTNVYQFEDAFAKFLSQLGLEAEVVEAATGSNSRRIFLIKSRPEVAMPEMPSDGKKRNKKIVEVEIKESTTVTEQLNKLRPTDLPASDKVSSIKAGKFKQGRYLKTKDYLKK